MSILPPIIAAFTAINGAHHWQEQFKPFKTEQEQIQAIKEELARGTFTDHWSPEDRQSLTQNPTFMNVKLHPFNARGKGFQLGLLTKGNSKKYTLDMCQTSGFFQTRNKHQVSQECKKYAATLGHEGAHMLHLELEEPSTHTAYMSFKRNIERDADNKGLEAAIRSDDLSYNEKLQVLLFEKYDFSANCQKNHITNNRKRSCESRDSAHPPCPERIKLIEKYIPHARLQNINDTIRDEIAWQ
jgi:hypothetical protein